MNNLNKILNGVIARAVVVLSACLVAGDLSAATPGVVADAPAISDANGAVTYAYGSGLITVSFRAQSAGSIPEYTAATVVADSSGSGSIFAGDYAAAGVKGVTFKIRSELASVSPAEAMLVLQARTSGRLWRNENVNVSAQQGVWVINALTMERSSGWTRDGVGDLDAMWQADLQDVELIGVRLTQPAREALSYSISDFKLYGEGFISDSATLTPLEQALYARFGVTNVNSLTSAQKAMDSNANGMADFIEILSEYDFLFANSIFLAEIVTDAGAGVLVRWPCVRDWKYTVMRADSLIAPLQDIAPAVDLMATNTGYMTYRDLTVTDEGSYFYRIRRVK